MTHGVVIGKFYPPHRGHKLLIDRAMAETDRVTVIVCDEPSQSIPARLRADWLQRIHPSAEVIIVPDNLSADDSEGWANLTIEALGERPDLVFTSEHYGDAYARFMGARHVSVDRERAFVPVSGTEIRDDPLAHWDYLEPCVRGYYAVRVVVVGAESTGTTTLALALAHHYKTAWVPEYGRIYAEGKMTGDGDWRSEEFVHIAQAQNRLEDALAETCSGLLICDTDAFATSIWHERYMGFRSRAVDACSDGRRPALYLLTGADIPFVQDGSRDGEHIRQGMHQRFVEELSARSIPWVLLEGDPDARMRSAMSAIAGIYPG